ncbi:hypothetical protein [Streptomyces sp. NPDC026589]|uniref:hypothetical protein n=1 Tax=Streptomyces sp. NPDC026589 TaxID=3155609 RepID=UPI0033E279D2
MVSLCAELGVGVVPFSPNGRGLLSGRPDTTAGFAHTFPGREDLPAASILLGADELNRLDAASPPPA